jgi:hypothetical protein
MTGGGPAAFISQSVDQNLADIMQARDPWRLLEEEFKPAAVADSFRPQDAVLTALAQFSQTEGGRAVMDWLHDMTDRAPYPQAIGSIEQVALAAAKHQGRAGIGLVLANAVAEGKRLLDQRKG